MGLWSDERAALIPNGSVHKAVRSFSCYSAYAAAYHEHCRTCFLLSVRKGRIRQKGRAHRGGIRSGQPLAYTAEPLGARLQPVSAFLYHRRLSPEQRAYKARMPVSFHGLVRTLHVLLRYIYIHDAVISYRGMCISGSHKKNKDHGCADMRRRIPACIMAVHTYDDNKLPEA